MSKHSSLCRAVRIIIPASRVLGWAGGGAQASLCLPWAAVQAGPLPGGCPHWPQSDQLGQGRAEVEGLRQGRGQGAGEGRPGAHEVGYWPRGLWLHGQELPQAWLGQGCAPACWGHPVPTKRTSPNRQWCCLVPGRKPQGKNGSRGSTGSPRTPWQGSPVRGGHQPQGQVLAASPHLLDTRGHGSHRPWSAAQVSVFQIHLHFSLDSPLEP